MKCCMFSTCVDKRTRKTVRTLEILDRVFFFFKVDNLKSTHKLKNILVLKSSTHIGLIYVKKLNDEYLLLRP
jgi:hypothetical protein